MEILEKLMSKVQRANTIIQQGLNESDIIKIPECTNIIGIVIFRLEEGKGVHTTCIGAIDFKAVTLALMNFYEHADEYDLRRKQQNAT